MDGRQTLARIFAAGPGGPVATRFVGVSKLVQPAIPAQRSVITRASGATWSVDRGSGGPGLNDLTMSGLEQQKILSYEPHGFLVKNTLLQVQW